MRCLRALALAAALASMAAGCPTDSGDSDGMISMTGTVYASAKFDQASCKQGCWSTPLAGAVVGTSLSSTTATTDAGGNFTLQTGAPSNKGKCVLWTITVDAPGYPHFAETSGWGDHSVGFKIALNSPSNDPCPS